MYNFSTMAIPIVEHYDQLRDESISLFASHKRSVFISVIMVIALVLFIVWAIRVREKILTNMHTAKTSEPTEILHTATALISTPSAITNILGSTDETTPEDVANDITYPTPTPFPVITYTPIPTPTPYHVVTTNTTTTSCTGRPTADNSQVYVSPATVSVGSTATISVVLQDCYNAVSPVTDTITITQSGGDSNVKINGSSSPVTVQTQNGKVSFSITSQNATTATFVINNSTRPFTVTTPGYHNPSVTFTNNSSGNASCTTAPGVPNAWYSDVYPNPPVTTDTGSIPLIVDIRDCNKNNAPVADTISIALSSGDPNTKVNGNSLPYSVTTQNGEVQFSVSSQVSGTVTLIVTDTTNSFTVTNTNNQNPSITFSTSSTTPAPTGTPTPTPTTTDTPALTPTGTTAPEPTPTTTTTITPTPGS